MGGSGVARYEAHQALKQRDPDEALLWLERMLEEGQARFPHEIQATVDAIKAAGLVALVRGLSRKLWRGLIGNACLMAREFIYCFLAGAAHRAA